MRFRREWTIDLKRNMLLDRQQSPSVMACYTQQLYNVVVLIPLGTTSIKKLGYPRRTARRALSVGILSTVAQLYEKIPFEKAIGKWPKVPLNVMRIVLLWYAIYHFLLLVCSNNVSILHRFRDITTFTVYVTAWDLEKSFSFDKTVEITNHVFFPIYV